LAEVFYDSETAKRLPPLQRRQAGFVIHSKIIAKVVPKDCEGVFFFKRFATTDVY
jgi:hypothetical protein